MASFKKSVGLLVLAAGLPVGAAFAQPTSVDAGGWRITVFDPPNVAVEAFVSETGRLFISKFATVIGTIEGGVPSPIVLNFQQIAPDAVTSDKIVIASEQITNQSGVDWNLYRQELVGSSFVQWNAAESSGWNPAPFTSNNFWSNNGLTLNVVDHTGGGVVANGATWQPSQNLVIDANLQGSQFPIIFSLKEIPVPTPGSVALSGLAVLAIARRRR